jgi:hypothetical protein
MYPCQVDPAYADELKRKEREEMMKVSAKKKKKKKKKKKVGVDSLNFECGDIFDCDAEDIFGCEPLDKPVKKKVKRQGPTLRSHSPVELPVKKDWTPSDDEVHIDFLPDDEDDGFESIPFVQPKWRKSREKKRPQRVCMLRVGKI